jgi:hypothetical protein
MQWGKVGRSFLLAAAIAFSAYILLSLSDWLFKTDFRFFVFAIKLMTRLQFQIFLCYLTPFIFFCLVLGTALNGQLRLCQKSGASIPLGRAMLINLVIMIIGIIGLLVYQYIPLLSGGTLSIPGEPLLTILGYQFIPLLGIVSLVTTYFFRKTGRIYVGAFLSAGNPFQILKTIRVKEKGLGEEPSLPPALSSSYLASAHKKYLPCFLGRLYQVLTPLMKVHEILGVFLPDQRLDGQTRLIHFFHMPGILYRFHKNRLDLLDDGVGDSLGSHDPACGR